MKHWWILFLALPALAETNTVEMLRGAKLQKPKKPDLVVGVNAVAGGVAQPGWPIIVTTDETAPANLKPRVTDEQNKEVPVTFERVKDSWIAGEAATQTLKPGRYHITLAPAGDLRIESGDLLVGDSDADALGLLKIQRALLTGHDDEALAEADRHPKSMDAWVAKGDILLHRDQPDEALIAYEKAFALMKEGENLPLMKRWQAAFFRSLVKRGVVTPAAP